MAQHIHDMDGPHGSFPRLDPSQPRVALESAVITHGLPEPTNLRTALSLERIVRDVGAEPRTIAVVNGALRADLDEPDLRRLAADPGVTKVSLRDLPIVAARSGTGGTTVAATLHIAALKGIAVFATGGIGGVHRRVTTDDPLDASADLVALANYPVCTVCAGAKSALDLPATAEMLETLGVTVVGFQTDSFPAFYSRTTSLPVDVAVESIEEVAEIVRARWRVQLSGAVLVVTPVPEPHSIPADEIEHSIEEGVHEARRLGLRSAEVTPFLLRHLADATDGRTLGANIALLENNARVAANLALQLAKTNRQTLT